MDILWIVAVMFGNEAHFVPILRLSLLAEMGQWARISIFETPRLPVIKSLAIDWLASLSITARRC